MREAQPTQSDCHLEFTSLVGQCMECGSAILNLTVDGERVMVEYAKTKAPRPGLIALNPRTRGARLVTEEDLPTVEAWQRGGATLHQRHSEQCVRRAYPCDGCGEPGSVKVLHLQTPLGQTSVHVHDDPACAEAARVKRGGGRFVTLGPAKGEIRR